jgi:hypothetical protein
MASTPLVGLDEAPETDADDAAAELDAPLGASTDLTQADNTPAGLETLPSEPLEIPIQLPPAPQPALANSAAGPALGMAATPPSEPSAEPSADPWQATIAPGEALANGASGLDATPSNGREKGGPTPSQAKPAQALDLGLEVAGEVEGPWGAATAPSFFDNDIRL